MENAGLPYFDLMNYCLVVDKNEHKHHISNTTEFVSALNLEPIHTKIILSICHIINCI